MRSVTKQYAIFSATVKYYVESEYFKKNYPEADSKAVLTEVLNQIRFRKWPNSIEAQVEIVNNLVHKEAIKYRREDSAQRDKEIFESAGG